MAGKMTEHFSFTTGVVRFHDLAYVASSFDELAKAEVVHSYVTEWDAGTWRKGEGDDQNKWLVAGATVVQEPLNQGLFLGIGGEVLCLGSGNTHMEQIKGTNGHMRGICTVEGNAYACGMNLQVYKRGENTWKSIDKGMRLNASGKDVRGFEAIGGYANDEIYAAGWNGEIWQYDGKKWERNESPTELIITSICCGEDGMVYMCGQSGLIIQGRNGGWRILEQKEHMKDNYWSLAWFGGCPYVSSMRGVYKIEDGRLVDVDFGKDEPETFYHLSAADGVLWSIGSKDIMSFDGKSWKRIE